MNAQIPKGRLDGSSRRGIALVITLLMLSVVTITAVAFLAVSRRERDSVSTAAEQANARAMADAAFRHAEGRILSRIAAATNRLASVSYFVSTNYANPRFRNLPGSHYVDTRDYRQLTNVSYTRTSNQLPFNLLIAGQRDEYARLLGNLYYDPRPPVFVQTNRDPRLPMDFRFYLDLNRNGQFETNGPVLALDRLGRPIQASLTNFQWGDPEWIGVLENPDVPHSGTNRFIGRFAYVVVPTSSTLDLNHSGNNAKRLNLGDGQLFPADQDGLQPQSGFFRNQGVGTWELNLGGFFGALNTNIWGFTQNDYRYETNLTLPNTGLAFADAERLRRFRQLSIAPVSADEFYRVESGNANVTQIDQEFRRDFVDAYSDGPLVALREEIFRQYENDVPDRSWPGSDLTNRFADLNDLFDPQLGMSGRITGQFTNRAVARTSPLSTYDRYTFHRLMRQLGTDSGDGRFESGSHPAFSDLELGVNSVNPYGFYRRAKLNLNYAQSEPEGDLAASASVSTLRPWGALEWFTNATHRLLLSEFTNGLPFLPQGSRIYRPGLGVHGWTLAEYTPRNSATPVVFLTNYPYAAQVHRQMQLAANIYDASVNSFFVDPINRIAAPTVFRPVLYEDSRTPGVLRLHSFEQITNITVAGILARQWTSPDLVTNRAPRDIGSPSATLTPSTPETAVTTRNIGVNLYGVPWILGAKKGLPNFNQALWQTVIQPTRRLYVTRPSRVAKIGQTELPFTGANGGGFRTEYQYLVNVTNLVGLEAWNSYLTNFPRNVRIFATNVLEFTLMDETIPGDPRVVLRRRELLSTNYLKSSWPARVYEAAGLVRNTNSPAYLEFPPYITNRTVPVPGGLAIGTSFIYDPVNRQAYPPNLTNAGRVVISQATTRYLTPVLSAYVTNSLVFAILDENSQRLLDLTTLRSTMVRTNVISTLGLNAQGAEQQYFSDQAGSSDNGFTSMPPFWNTNLVQANRTLGIENQMLASVGTIQLPRTLWRNPTGAPVREDQIQESIDGLKYFLYGILPAADPAYIIRIRQNYGSNLVTQVGFNPSPRVFLSDRRMANDPLVHYTKDDLSPGYFFLTEAGYTEVPHEFFGRAPGSLLGISLTTNFVAFDVGRSTKFVNAYAPWGTNANLTGLPIPATAAGSTAFDYAFKDPLIRSSDDWKFPVGTNTTFRFGGVGQLGRVHRGTPWQTIYLKSLPAFELPPDQASVATRLTGGRLTWGGWAGDRYTHPTNDWKLMDLFTASLNDNSARGQVGVNQTGEAAWAAVVSGLPLLENTSTADPDLVQPLFLRPDSPRIAELVSGYKDSRNNRIPGISQMQAATNQAGVLLNPDGAFQNLGAVLQVPTLSDRAPFLKTDLDWSRIRNVGDEVLERLPQQAMSLLRADEPRYVVYAYGQNLKPAQNAINLRPGPLYGISTNYTITGEFVTKTVFRIDGDPRMLRPVVEDQRVILSNP